MLFGVPGLNNITAESLDLLQMVVKNGDKSYDFKSEKLPKKQTQGNS